MIDSSVRWNGGVTKQPISVREDACAGFTSRQDFQNLNELVHSDVDTTKIVERTTLGIPAKNGVWLPSNRDSGRYKRSCHRRAKEIDIAKR
jgi:hypothetical protein